MSQDLQSVLGFDFTTELPSNSDEGALVITSLSQWEDDLIRGIEAKDEKIVFACCDQFKKFKKTFPNKVQNKWIMSLVVDNFSAPIADRLLQAGATLPYVDKLFRQAAINNHLDALIWLKNQKVSPVSNYGLTGAFNEASRNANLDIVQLLLTPERMVGLGAYSYNLLLSEALNQKRVDLACQMMASSAVDDREKYLRKYSTQTENSVQVFLTCFANKLSFNQCSVLQECLSHEDVARTWKKTLPLKITKGGGHIVCKDLIDVLLAYASPAVTEIVATSYGEDLVSKRLCASALLIESFLHSAPAHIRSKVVKAIAPSFADWKDGQGRNLGHYMLSASPTKSSADEVYSLNKDWLLAEDDNGKTPLSAVHKDIQAYATNKLTRKVLNDHGLGLRQSHAPQRARRM